MKYLTEIILMMILSFAAGALCFIGVKNNSWATVIAAIGAVMVTGWVIVDKTLDDLSAHKKQVEVSHEITFCKVYQWNHELGKFLLIGRTNKNDIQHIKSGKTNQIQVNISGVVRADVFYSIFQAGEIAHNIKIECPNGKNILAVFFIDSMETLGMLKNAIKYSATLKSSGEPKSF